ncbi:hypothetical protein HK100_012618 [Physocladia obscura]|uniref:Rad21/Rec8-like protein C-terminal eukaryotic domain-containing protein n=1 Tax=Physocladia obscura TaxID=109957 RepID=A0AAD5XGN4_9FUNG|nr:hypothetical protein HK100_012618 [Physocladia obscura]
MKIQQKTKKTTVVWIAATVGSGSGIGALRNANSGAIKRLSKRKFKELQLGWILRGADITISQSNIERYPDSPERVIHEPLVRKSVNRSSNASISIPAADYRSFNSSINIGVDGGSLLDFYQDSGLASGNAFGLGADDSGESFGPLGPGTSGESVRDGDALDFNFYEEDPVLGINFDAAEIDDENRIERRRTREEMELNFDNESGFVFDGSIGQFPATQIEDFESQPEKQSEVTVNTNVIDKAVELKRKRVKRNHVDIQTILSNKEMTYLRDNTSMMLYRAERERIQKEYDSKIKNFVKSAFNRFSFSYGPALDEFYAAGMANLDVALQNESIEAEIFVRNEEEYQAYDDGEQVFPQTVDQNNASISGNDVSVSNSISRISMPWALGSNRSSLSARASQQHRNSNVLPSSRSNASSLNGFDDFSGNNAMILGGSDTLLLNTSVYLNEIIGPLNNRAASSQAFYHVLFLLNRNEISVEQSRPFADIKLMFGIRDENDQIPFANQESGSENEQEDESGAYEYNVSSVDNVSAA